MLAIADAIRSLPKLDSSVFERPQFWSLTVVLEDGEIPEDVVGVTFDLRDGVLAATADRLALVTKGDSDDLVNTAIIPYREIEYVQTGIAGAFNSLTVGTPELRWEFVGIVGSNGERFANLIRQRASAQRTAMGTSQSSHVQPHRTPPRGSPPPKQSQSTASLSPAKIVIGAIVLLVVVIGACTAAVGCNDCESAWDKCTQGDCSDWDRATDNGRSDRCDYLINERFR